MTPAQILQQWFDAHARDDRSAAAALLAGDAPIRLPDGGSLAGFDAFMQWYDARRDREGPSFAYEVLDVLDGANHAAAIIRINDAARAHRQVAVYAIEDERITAIDLFETDE